MGVKGDRSCEYAGKAAIAKMKHMDLLHEPEAKSILFAGIEKLLVIKLLAVNTPAVGERVAYISFFGPW